MTSTQSSPSAAPRRATGAGSAGAVSALVVKTAFAPLDRIRIVLQNESLAKSRASTAPFNGISDTVTRLFKDQGLKSLWRGNGANCLRIVPTYFLRFALFDRLKDPALLPFSGFSQRIAAGSLSGAIVCIATYPLELCRVRLAADLTSSVNNYSGITDCIRSSVRHEGYRVMFKGLGVSIAEIAPFIGISFGLYDHITANTGVLNKWERLGIGTSSTIAALLVCYPLDTVRRQLMLDGSTGYHSRYEGSAIACVRMLLAEGGLRRFYRGCSVVCLRAPSMGITLVLQDLFSKVDLSLPLKL